MKEKKSAVSDAVKYDARSFIIRGKRELMIGGEFHYFRTPRELWEDRILKVKASGSNLITTYIPWNWHEQVEGKEQWEGDHDLCRFIELCTKHDMFIIVKPGPYCCAELDFGGHPDWILGKKIPLRVLNDKYLKYVEKWYKKVGEVIQPYLVTNGGNVFSIQVENEYDHLIHMGREKITFKDAITYFNKLIKMMEKYGINIPKFANEAAFLRGRPGIIDTRTYYPTIPIFKGWEWQLEHYDEKIALAKKGQPDSPTMILELQIGWFGMHGHDWKDTDLNLTEAVTKSSIILGSSVLNYYMMVGGTTFPFWGSRGDIFNLSPKGTGLITSFDFGGSPVQEWGQLHPERFYWIRAFNRFAKDFQSLLLDGDNVDNVKVIAGGDDVRVVSPQGVKNDTDLSNHVEKFTVLTKKRGDEYLLCVRNIAPEKRNVTIGLEGKEPFFKNLKLDEYETLLLPANVKVPGADITIVRSTSELLFAHKAGSAVHFGLMGKKGAVRQTVLNVPASSLQVVSGNVKISGNGNQAVLDYTHDGIQVVKVNNSCLWLLDLHMAGRVEPLEHGMLVADTYYLKSNQAQGANISLATDMRNDSQNTFYYLGERTLKSAVINGQTISASANNGIANVSYRNPQDQAIQFEWLGDWKTTGDVEEIKAQYKDKDWAVLKKPISLEEAGLLEHGYVWFRQEFNVPAGAKDTQLIIPANDTDRFYVYVNGKRVWNGITQEANINIQGAVKTGKNQLAILYQNFYHTKSHPNEGVLQKYSGIQKPVLVKGKAKNKAFTVKISSFKVRQQLTGILDGYTQLNYDDSKWLSVKPGSKYIMGDGQETLMWMRRKFKLNVKPGWSCGIKLTIPRGNERCLIYINGRATAWFEGVGPQHDFFVPESFLQKENVMSIILEGPNQGYLAEPEIGTFFSAKAVDVRLQF